MLLRSMSGGNQRARFVDSVLFEIGLSKEFTVAVGRMVTGLLGNSYSSLGYKRVVN